MITSISLCLFSFNSFCNKKNDDLNIIHVFTYGLEDQSTIDFIIHQQKKGRYIIVDNVQHFGEKRFIEGYLKTEKSIHKLCDPIKSKLRNVLDQDNLLFYEEERAFYVDYFKKKNLNSFNIVAKSVEGFIDLNHENLLSLIDDLDSSK
jgi:hypothetical protein